MQQLENALFEALIPRMRFSIPLNVVKDGLETMSKACDIAQKDPKAFLTSIFPKEPDHFIDYLLGKYYVSIYDLFRSDRGAPVSLSLMLSRKTVSDMVIQTISAHIKDIDGVQITLQEQLALSWLARTFKASMSIIEMDQLFPGQGETLMKEFHDQGFERWLSSLNDNDLERIIKWASDTNAEKGHVGHDHEIMRLMFKEI